MLVWGGQYFDFDTTSYVYLNSGGGYVPTSNTWTAIPTEGPNPAGRARHSAVWTGTGMVIWGGMHSPDFTTEVFGDGGFFTPQTVFF